MNTTTLWRSREGVLPITSYPSVDNGKILYTVSKHAKSWNELNVNNIEITKWSLMWLNFDNKRLHDGSPNFLHKVRGTCSLCMRRLCSIRGEPCFGVWSWSFSRSVIVRWFIARSKWSAAQGCGFRQGCPFSRTLRHLINVMELNERNGLMDLNLFQNHANTMNKT